MCGYIGGVRGGWHDRAEEGGGDSDARGLHGRRHGGAGQEEAEPQLLRIVRKEESERQASVSFSCVILSKIYLFKGLKQMRPHFSSSFPGKSHITIHSAIYV